MTLRARHLWFLALAALALRAPFLLLSPAGFDPQGFAGIASVPGAGLYSAVETAGRYPYTPLWWLLLRALKGLQSLAGGDFALWARLPGVLGDAGVACLAYLIVERRSRSGMALAAGPNALISSRAGLMAGLAWALNPLAVLVSAGHGQFDSVALGLLLAAAWWLDYSSQSRSELWAALSLAAAVALKTWPIAFLPLYLGAFASRRDALRFAFWVLAPPLLLLAPWLWMDGAAAVLSRFGRFTPSGLGLSGALRSSLYAVGAPLELYHRAWQAWSVLSAGLLAFGFGWMLWRRRRLRLLDSLAWAALGLLLFMPAVTPQSLLWPVALALVLPGGAAWRLSLLGLPLLLVHDALFMPTALAGRFAWQAPFLPPSLRLLWAVLALAWWAWCLSVWPKLLRLDPAVRKGIVSA